MCDDERPTPGLSYRSGETVMVCEPLVSAVIDSKRSAVCAYCYHERNPYASEPDHRLERCAACRRAHYCGRTCQKMDWRYGGHRLECRAMSTSGDRRPLDSSMARLLFRLYSVTTVHAESAARVANIIGRADRIAGDPKWLARFERVCRSLSDAGVRFERSAMLELFARLVSNQVSIFNANFFRTGAAFYVETASIRHSCSPNTAGVYSGKVLELRAISDIAAGEDLTISRIDLLMDRDDRRRKLRSHFLVDRCDCHKCETESDRHIDYRLAQRMDRQFRAESNLLKANTNNWRLAYEIGVQLMPVYRRVYGRYHPFVTLRLIGLLNSRLQLAGEPPESLFELLREVDRSVKLTHGVDHELYSLLMTRVTSRLQLPYYSESRHVMYTL